MCKKSALLIGLIVFVGCATSLQDFPREPVPLRTEDGYAARRDAALLKVMLWNEDEQEMEFSGRTEYVSLSDFKFAPSQIHFKSETVVRVRLKNTGMMLHYFGGEDFFKHGAEIIDLFGAVHPNQLNIPVPALTWRDVYFFIKDRGEYPLSCFVPDHIAKGMTGTLIVEP